MFLRIIDWSEFYFIYFFKKKQAYILYFFFFFIMLGYDKKVEDTLIYITHSTGLKMHLKLMTSRIGINSPEYVK